MGRVSREQVTEYQTVGQQIEDAARETVRAMLGGIDLMDEGAWGEIVDIVQQIFGRYGNDAAYVGQMWYQRCRDIETDGSGTYTAEPYLDDKLYGRITNETKRVLEAVKSGDKTADEAMEAIEAAIGNYTAKVNRDTVQENLNKENAAPVKSGRSRVQIQKEKSYRRKYVGKVHYMRVPRAGCTCSFCITMASRGAVYRTRETAGGGDPVNRYHMDCRCSVVPVEGEDPIIDGYTDELNRYYDTYADAYDKLGDLERAARTNSLTGKDADLWERIEKARKSHEARQAKDESIPDWKPINSVSIVMRYQNEGMT